MRVFSIVVVACAITTTAIAAPKKDTISVGTKDGSKIEVKVPHDLQVKQIGPNHYEIHRNDPALKKIEIKVTPPPK